MSNNIVSVNNKKILIQNPTIHCPDTTIKRYVQTRDPVKYTFDAALGRWHSEEWSLFGRSVKNESKVERYNSAYMSSRYHGIKSFLFGGDGKPTELQIIQKEIEQEIELDILKEIENDIQIGLSNGLSEEAAAQDLFARAVLHVEQQSRIASNRDPVYALDAISWILCFILLVLSFKS